MNKEAIEWLRQQVMDRLEQARAATPGPWQVAQQPGRQVVYSTHFDNDGRQGYITDVNLRENAPHIALNDPQDVIARCEAELAIVTRCEAVLAAFADPERGLWPDVTRRERTHASATLHDLAAGYRHRDGYAQHWGEA